jgi:hypothetical protein
MPFCTLTFTLTGARTLPIDRRDTHARVRVGVRLTGILHQPAFCLKANLAFHLSQGLFTVLATRRVTGLGGTV